MISSNHTDSDTNTSTHVNSDSDNTTTVNYTTELLMNNDESNQKWIEGNSNTSSNTTMFISTFPEFGIRKGDRQSDSDDDEQITNNTDNSGITLLSAPIVLVEKTVDVTKDIVFNPIKYFFG